MFSKGIFTSRISKLQTKSLNSKTDISIYQFEIFAIKAAENKEDNG